MSEKIRPAVFQFFDTVRDGLIITHVMILDTDGNIHERFSDDPPGEWGTWDASFLPERKNKPPAP